MQRTITFFGTPDFACPVLKALHDADNINVASVVTQPDRPVGRKRILTPPPIKVLADELAIPTQQPERIRDLHMDQTPDFFVVFAYGKILPQTLLDTPRIAPLNIHPSLLPQWRGPSPVQQAILSGDTETGVSIQRMVLALDSGPIVAQERTHIQPRETSSMLMERLVAMGTQLLLETLRHPLSEVQQDDAQASYCEKLNREAGAIDITTLTAVEVDRHVRALVPWPGVRTTINGHSLKIIEASMEQNANSIPVLCKGNTVLHLVRVQSPGKNIVTGQEWERGLGNRE